MKILWKVIWKEIRQKLGRFAALVTGMTAAVFLITVVTAFSNSCLQSMIRQEKEENGPYEAVFHNLTREQARRLAENDQIRETYKLTDCKEGDTQEGRNCYGASFQKISLSIFERSQDVGVEIGMDVVPLEEQKVLFSRPNWSVTSSFDITFNEKLLGYYGINAAGVTAGSAWAIALIDGVIVLFAAALLYYVVLSGLEEKLKTLGLLDGIGISDRQKRLYIYGENLLAGCLAVPLGMLLGLAGLAASIRYLNQWVLPTQKVEMYVSPLWLGAVLAGCMALVLLSGVGLYARAKKERVLDLISGYDKEEELNRTAVLLKAKKHFFRAETLLAVKNVIMNHRNYAVSATLLVIALCVFLNGIMYIRGMTAVVQDIPVHQPVSMWISGNGRQKEDLAKLAEKLEGMEEIEQTDVIQEAGDYTALEGMTQPEMEAYLRTFQAEGILEGYELLGTYERTDLDWDGGLGTIVRVIGVDDRIFRDYLDQGGVRKEVPEGSAVLIRTRWDGLKELKEFPVMIQGEIQEVPVACTLFEDRGEALLPEYLRTAEESEKGVGLYSPMESVKLYVSLDTFARLMEAYPDAPVYIELTLARDQGKQVSLNDILYPDQAVQRMKEDDRLREKIRQTARELGIEGLQIYSFAEEYQRSFFQGGKGMRILLVTALVSASWIAAILVILQKDAACIRRRKKEFALLLTIGMTRGRVYKMIFLEHLLYAFAGIVAGIPLSLFFLSGIYNDGGARQMTSAWDVPIELVGWQVILTFCVVLIPFLYTVRELRKMDMIQVIRKEE